MVGTIEFQVYVPSLPPQSAAVVGDLIPIIRGGTPYQLDVASLLTSGLPLAGTVVSTGSITARTLANRFADIINVKDYGATGNGTTDDTAFINAAFAAVSTSGAIVFFPPGSYSVTGVTTVNPCLILGCGFFGATLVARDSTTNVLTIASSYTIVRDLGFDYSVTRAEPGAFISLSSGIARLLIESCLFMHYAIGITVNAVSTLTIRDCDFLVGTSGIGSGINIVGGSGLVIDTVTMDGPSGAQPFAGIHVEICGDIIIANSDIIHHGQDLFVNPPSGRSVTSLWATHTFFDTATHGILIQPGSGGTVDRCKFDNCWFSSHSDDGARVDNTNGTIDGIEFIHCHGFLNGGNGLNAIGSSNLQVDGGFYAQNGGDGLLFGGAATGFSVQGVRSGACCGLTANGSYGISVTNTAADNYIVAFNNIVGNTSSGLHDLGTGMNKIVTPNLS